MPVYSATAPIYAIYPGEPGYAAISNEASTVYPTGTPAGRCAIGEPYGKNRYNVAVELIFSANPGVFEIDVQTADTDGTNNYQTVTGGAITTATQGSGGGSGYSARAELQVQAHFVRAFVKTQTANGVNITCTISN